MPELPEVEVIRAGLDAHISGRAIVSAQVLHPRPIRSFHAGVAEFEKSITGRVFAPAKRRGKYLWLPFADGDALVAHLGMSGQFRIADVHAELPRHTRVCFTLSDGSQLRFIDQRMFGGLELATGGAELPEQVVHIALDLFDDAFDAASVAARIQTSRSAIKRVLLNQRIVSGIGNIYADEALWLASIHPDSPANTLTLSQIIGILDATKSVMTIAIAAGGTSFDALYVNVSGESGYFALQLNAYGRFGLPCNRCGAILQRSRFTGRSSVFCPTCQPLNSIPAD